jgi:hypothetical protein
MDSPACPNCGTRVPLQGADDEWCEACGKKLPLAVVAAVHAAAKRLRKAQAAEASDSPESSTPAQSAKRLPGCTIFGISAAIAFLGPLAWLAFVAMEFGKVQQGGSLIEVGAGRCLPRAAHQHVARVKAWQGSKVADGNSGSSDEVSAWGDEPGAPEGEGEGTFATEVALGKGDNDRR